MTYINLSLFSLFFRFVIPIRDLLVNIFTNLLLLILSNKFLLICLILLSVITILLILSTYLKILDRQQYDNTNVKIDTLSYLIYLNKYYSYNIFITCFKVILYIFMTIIIFLYLRYSYIGKSTYTLTLFDPNHYTWEFFILIILVIITFICYKRTLELLLYPEILKLHIYLQCSSIYVRLLDYLRVHSEVVNLIHISSFFYNICNLSSDHYIELSKFRISWDNKEDKFYFHEKIAIRLIVILKANKILRILSYPILYLLYKLFKILQINLNTWLYYLVPSIPVHVFIYEVYMQKFHYIYDNLLYK